MTVTQLNISETSVEIDESNLPEIARAVLTVSAHVSTAFGLCCVCQLLIGAVCMPCTQENQELLCADPGSAEWQAYTDYIDRIILRGFVGAVRCRLQYFLENTEPGFSVTPLFEVQLVLNGSDMSFRPPIDLSKKDNFYDLIDRMLDNIFKMASCIRRVAKHNQTETYQVRKPSQKSRTT